MTHLDRLSAEVVAARAADPKRDPEPGLVRRTEAALQREIGVGDITTALLRRWASTQLPRP